MGVYAGLDQTAPRILALPMLALGVVVAVVGLVSAGRRVQRTPYRPDRWRVPELVVMASGVAAAVTMVWVSRNQIPVAYPDLTSLPTLTVAALLAATVGLVAGPASPEPKLVVAA